MRRAIFFAFIIFAFGATAQTFWNFDEIERGHARREQSRAEIDRHGFERPFRMPEWRPTPRYSYPYYLTKLCEWWAFWQLMDTDSIEHGGIIEAETGALRHVIQTDNTQEVVWCWAYYTDRSGDSTYLHNIDSAWIYLSNFPAYHEELSYIGGSFVSYYYRVWNSALALLMEMGLREFLDDHSRISYADSCVDIIMNHRLSMDTPWPSIDGLHALVTAFSAGCLYQYGIDRERPDWCDTAVVIARTVQPWIDRNPSGHMAYSNWAMSSGTVIWGLMNSRFAAFPESLDTWLDIHGDHIPERIEPPTEYDPYVWDNSWNIWFGNAFRHLWKATGEDDWYFKYRTILDDLLAQDTDDDGGIPASAAGPDYEDMTWISAYLTLFSMDWIIDSLPEVDVGALNPTVHMPMGFATQDDTVYLVARAVNFGRSAVRDVDFMVTHNRGILFDTTYSFAWGEAFPRDTFKIVPGFEGDHRAGVSTLLEDDDPWNDTAAVEFFVTPVREISGSIFDSEAGEGAVSSEVRFYYLGEDTSFFYKADSSDGHSTSNFATRLPCLTFRVEIDPEFPYVPAVIETFAVLEDDANFLSVPLQRADLLLVDDDLGRNYEQYYMSALDSIGVSFRLWDRDAMGEISPEVHQQMRRQTVIWFTGDDTTTTLDSADIHALDHIVRTGGNVLLTGQGMGFDLAGTPKFDSLISAIWLGSDGTPMISGVPDDPISGDFREIITFGTSGGAGNQTRRDRLSPLAPAVGFLRFPCGASAAVRREDPSSGGKLVFIGFGLEGISHPAGSPAYTGRPELMLSILRWFNATFQVAEQILPKTLEIRAYPNPFNSTVRISIEGPAPTRVEIFDIAGRRIDVIARSDSDEKSPYASDEISPLWVEMTAKSEGDCFGLRSRNDGMIEFSWSPPESLPSGVYLIRAFLVENSVAKRVVYLK